MYAHTWGPRLEYILRNSLLTLLSTNAKLEDVLTILTNEEYRKKIVDHLDDQVLKNFWISEFNVMSEKTRIEAISPILNKVGQFVTSPLVRNVVNTTTSSFDIESVMNDGKILLVNVSQGKLGEDNMALLGAMIITKIQLAAMNRVYVPEEQRRDFYLYIDEFQNFATTSFVKILSEARKYRLNLTLANQYMAQIPDEVKASIFGNAGSMLSFILGAQDAEWMVKEFGSRYSQEDLVSLGRYQIISKLMIDGQVSPPFPGTTLNLAASTNQNREKVIRVSRERFAKKKE
jgi:type IV secretory pathway TraG/TraD family ATPase VirD4